MSCGSVIWVALRMNRDQIRRWNFFGLGSTKTRHRSLSAGRHGNEASFSIKWMKNFRDVIVLLYIEKNSSDRNCTFWRFQLSRVITLTRYSILIFRSETFKRATYLIAEKFFRNFLGDESILCWDSCISYSVIYF